jgi:ribulose 1,5-bisphosphate synthetase/thiazole synthase
MRMGLSFGGDERAQASHCRPRPVAIKQDGRATCAGEGVPRIGANFTPRRLSGQQAAETQPERID